MSATIDWGIATQTIKYVVNSDAHPALTINDIRFSTAYFDKLMKQTAGIYDATDPDLRAFKAHGGKLLLWHGLADPAISPVGTIAYYQAVQNFMGGAAQTADFARLFMLPGGQPLPRRGRPGFVQRPRCAGGLGRAGQGAGRPAHQQGGQRPGDADPAGLPVPADRGRHHRRSGHRGRQLHAAAAADLLRRQREVGGHVQPRIREGLPLVRR
jgi:hypothetical protein